MHLTGGIAHGLFALLAHKTAPNGLFALLAHKTAPNGLFALLAHKTAPNGLFALPLFTEFLLENLRVPSFCCTRTSLWSFS
jgi:Gpi18-like mannosyltransferase